MIPEFLTATTETLLGPSQEERDAAVAGPGGKAAHDALAARTPALRRIEWRDRPGAGIAPGAFTLAAWNLERCKYLPPTIDLLRRTGADVLLLSEMDLGMARSGNRHTTAQIGEALGMDHVFVTEFVELGLGDAREQAWHAGESNAQGLHGNAVLSKTRLSLPSRIALDDGGLWFEGVGDQRRIGGRCAACAVLATPAGPLTLASLHLESRSDAAMRERQMMRLLEVAGREYGDGPMVIAGDCNTDTMPTDADPEDRQARWFTEAASEPLFARLAEAGFTWVEANTPAPTERQRPDGAPKPPFRRIDWIFARGVGVRNPKTWPAVDAAGSAISDHELITVEIVCSTS